MCVCVCMYVSMYVRMYVCMYVCILYLLIYWHAPLHWYSNTTCYLQWYLHWLLILVHFVFVLRSPPSELIALLFFYEFISCILSIFSVNFVNAFSVFWWAYLYLLTSCPFFPLLLLSVLCLHLVVCIRAVCVQLFDCRFRMDSLVLRWFWTCGFMPSCFRGLWSWL